MYKSALRIGVLAVALLAVVYGCGDGDAPTAPDGFELNAVGILEVTTCGEDSYLMDLSSETLPDWQDSIEAWLPAAVLNDTPLWAAENTVAEFLGALIPALQQWQAAINTANASGLLGAVADFDATATTTQEYLGGLSSLLAGWETAMETARAADFLRTPPVFAADDVPPVIACANDTTITCADPEGAVFDFEIVAMDDCDDAPVVSCEPPSGSLFAPGTTEVICTATDASGNLTTCSFNVTVEPSSVTINEVTASPAVLWPPNHKMVDISFDVDAENECELELSCSVVEVSSNEPANATGDGNTEPDWMIGEDGSLKLRAERSGQGSGRVYSVTILCEDSTGAGEEVTVEISVPHDQGGDDSDD